MSRALAVVFSLSILSVSVPASVTVRDRGDLRAAPTVKAAFAGAATAGGLATEDAAADLPPAVPADWWGRVQKDIQQSEYHITWQEKGALPDTEASPGQAFTAAYQAPNRAQDYRTYFTPDGIRLTPRTLDDEGGSSSSWEWGLELTGYGDAGQAVAPAQLSVAGNRIEYRRGALTEWYVNDERGLEQGFTIAAPGPPSVSDPGSLITLEMAVSGDLAASQSQDGQAIEFSTSAGVPVVRYAGLLAYDATGRELPATMEHDSPSLRLVVDARSAAYPITIDPVASNPNPNWTAQGGAASTAGDVNGDGYDDVIIGAPHFDNGQSGEGRVWVYHGSASGLISPAAFIREGNQANARFGDAVSTAGDVNRDGYDDVIVGAPFFSNGHSAEGLVVVYHGSASGLIIWPAFISESNQAHAGFGDAVSAAGDFNSDGYGDVIVGAPYFDNPEPEEGGVWIYYGSASGLIPYPGLWAEGNQADALFGHDVSTAGDVHRDGAGDVIVGGRDFANGQIEGWVAAYYGQPPL